MDQTLRFILFNLGLGTILTLIFHSFVIGNLLSLLVWSWYRHFDPEAALKSYLNR